MDEVEDRKMRFALSETLEGIMSEIISKLPEIKIDWVIKKDDKGKPFYGANVGSIYVEIHETFADFTLKYKTLPEETKRYQKVSEVSGRKIRTKLNIYAKIGERILNDDEHKFYKRVLRSINSQHNAQKEKNELTFTESTDDF